MAVIMERRWVARAWKLPMAAAALALLASVASIGPADAASVLISDPSLVVPEGILVAPGGGLLVFDATGHAIVPVSTSGVIDTANIEALGSNVSPFGEIQLGSNYGSNAGQYLLYGRANGGSAGYLALTGTTGLGTPTNVSSTDGYNFTGADVAPTDYGTGRTAIQAGDIVLASELGTNQGIVVLTPNGNTFAPTLWDSLPLSGDGPFGIAFAPSNFGAYSGDLFVSDGLTGDVYVVLPDGSTVLFATLPLPSGFSKPGLRQIAFAPSNFSVPCQTDPNAAPTLCSGDLFVSVSPQDNGGGNNGYIEALNATGQLDAGYVYQAGGSGNPLAPRGLTFDGSTLYVANADPGVNTLATNDFLPAAQFETIPEPGSMSMLVAGLVAMTGLGRLGRRPKASSSAATGQAGF